MQPRAKVGKMPIQDMNRKKTKKIEQERKRVKRRKRNKNERHIHLICMESKMTLQKEKVKQREKELIMQTLEEISPSPPTPPHRPLPQALNRLEVQRPQHFYLTQTKHEALPISCSKGCNLQGWIWYWLPAPAKGTASRDRQGSSCQLAERGATCRGGYGNAASCRKRCNL